MKAAVCWVLAALLVVFLGWFGLFVYWHVRIQRAIQTIDLHANPDEVDRAYAELSSAGCRSLPYLIRVVDPQRDQPWIWRTLYRTAADASITGSMRYDVRCTPSLEMLEGFCVHWTASPAVLRERHARILAWWKADGPLFHQWWRVWSSRCGS
jgi:hypothetical protein